MTVALNEAGRFTWSEWAAVFGPKVQNVGADGYWQAWSEAFVALLEQLRIAETADIQTLTDQWQAAARQTPHGQPIELSAAPRD